MTSKRRFSPAGIIPRGNSTVVHSQASTVINFEWHAGCIREFKLCCLLFAFLVTAPKSTILCPGNRRCRGHGGAGSGGVETIGVAVDAEVVVLCCVWQALIGISEKSKKR